MLLLEALLALSCGTPVEQSEQAEPAALVTAPNQGAVLARVGASSLYEADVDPMAEAASQMRLESLGVRPPTETRAQRLALAVEWLALAEQSRRMAADQPVEWDAYRRAMAQAYLNRAIAPLDAAPVSEQELAAAYRGVIEDYLARGESDLYEPSRMDVAIIGVGAFPDWSPHHDASAEPVLDPASIERLATEIKQACTDRVADLDDFIAIARKFSQGHPSERIEFKSREALDPALSRLPPEVHRVAVGLDGNGAVGPIIHFPGLALVVRRGPTYPGRGEDLEAIRDQLASAVRLERKRRRLESLLAELKNRLDIQTWPEKLASADAEKPTS